MNAGSMDNADDVKRPALFCIVPLRAEQLAAAAEVEKQCFSVPWSLPMLEAAFANPLACFFAAQAHGAGEGLAGYAGMTHVLDEGSVLNVAVRPDFRRRGIAKALLCALDEKARSLSLRFLTLEVRPSNEAARRLYAAAGYRPAGRRRGYYQNPAEDAVLMTKTFD